MFFTSLAVRVWGLAPVDRRRLLSISDTKMSRPIRGYFAGTLQHCVPALNVRVCRNGVPAAKYLPERRSAAFRLHYSTAYNIRLQCDCV